VNRKPFTVKNIPVRGPAFIATQLAVTLLFGVGLPALVWSTGTRDGGLLLLGVCGAIVAAGIGDAIVGLRTLEALSLEDGLARVRAGRRGHELPADALVVRRPVWLRFLFKNGSALCSKDPRLWVYVPAQVLSFAELTGVLASHRTPGNRG
jgi:hypothetical protein